MYPGSGKLDASVALAVRFRFDGRDRLLATLRAIDRELGQSDFHYRYSGMPEEEGCFIACSYWMAEAYARLGFVDDARARVDALNGALGRCQGVLSEMVDPDTGHYLGNTPQGLSHLAQVMAMATVEDSQRCP